MIPTPKMPPRLKSIPDLRFWINQPETVLLHLDEYEVDEDTPPAQLAWSIMLDASDNLLWVDAQRRLVGRGAAAPGLYAATVQVSDGEATASQQVWVKIFHFVLDRFVESSPVVLHSHELFTSAESLYDRVLPRNFPRDQIAWNPRWPLPEGIHSADVLQDGRYVIEAEATPPAVPVNLVWIARYLSPTPTTAPSPHPMPTRTSAPTLTPSPLSTRTPTPSFTPAILPTHTPTPSPTSATAIVLEICSHKTIFDEALSLPVGAGPRDLAVSQVNDDAAPDFLTANYETNTATLWLSREGSYFRYDLPCGEGCLDVEFSDLNQNARPEMILLGAINAQLSVYALDAMDRPSPLASLMLDRLTLPGEARQPIPLDLLAPGPFF